MNEKLYDLNYLDGGKEFKVKEEFVHLPVKRTVGWNPQAAKAKAEERFSLLLLLLFFIY